MKKSIVIIFVIAALMLSLAACGNAPVVESKTPITEPQVTEASATPIREL